MKAQTAGWFRRYQGGLREHLAKDSGTSLPTAFKLGRQAVVLGLETLELARLHEHALTTVVALDVPARTRRKRIELARVFFAETLVPIESTHRGALTAAAHTGRLTRALQQRTAELSASNRRLKRSILQRKGSEAALKRSSEQHAALMAEAHRLQNHLRRLTRQILSAQEDERRKRSRLLHNEIAQRLLGIHVRLLSLNTAMRSSTEDLNKEIGSTQRLVIRSKQKVRRLAQECVNENKA